jgi:hypothetical protein
LAGCVIVLLSDFDDFEQDLSAFLINLGENSVALEDSGEFSKELSIDCFCGWDCGSKESFA